MLNWENNDSYWEAVTPLVRMTAFGKTGRIYNMSGGKLRERSGFSSDDVAKAWCEAEYKSLLLAELGRLG